MSALLVAIVLELRIRLEMVEVLLYNDRIDPNMIANDGIHSSIGQLCDTNMTL